MSSIFFPNNLDSSINYRTTTIEQCALKDRVCVNWKKSYFIAATAMILIGVALSFFFNLPSLALILSMSGLVHMVVYHSCGAQAEESTSIPDQKPKKKPEFKEPEEPVIEATSDPEPKLVEKHVSDAEWYNPGEDTFGASPLEDRPGVDTIKAQAPVLRANLLRVNWKGTTVLESSTTSPETDPATEKSLSDSEDDESGRPNDAFKKQITEFFSPEAPEEPEEEKKSE